MRKFTLSLTLITLLGAAVRVLLLLRRGSFWFDELFSLRIAQMPFLESLRLAATDTNPPLWNLLLWPLVRINVMHEWWPRLPSVALGTASVFLLGIIGKKIGGKRTGLLAAGFGAFSPLLVFYSTEARNYALWIFLVLLTFLLLLALFENTLSVRKQAPYAASLFLMLWSHTYAVIPAMAFWGWGTLNMRAQKKSLRRTWHALHGSFFLLFALWFLFSFGPKLTDLLKDSWFISTPGPRGWPLNIFTQTFAVWGSYSAFSYGLLTASLIILLCLSVALLALQGRRIKTVTQSKHAALVLVLGIGFATAAVFGPANTKYFLFMVPFLLLLYSYLLTLHFKNIILRHTIVLLLLLISVSSTAGVARRFRFSWDRAAAFAHTSANPILIAWAPNALTFEYYYRGERKNLLIIPTPGTETTDIFTLHKTNWKFTLPTEYLHAQLTRAVPESGNLLVVQAKPRVTGLDTWLEQNGYILIAEHAFDPVQIVILEHYYKGLSPNTISTAISGFR